MRVSSSPQHSQNGTKESFSKGINTKIHTCFAKIIIVLFNILYCLDLIIC